jgi:hypothetical protein
MTSPLIIKTLDVINAIDAAGILNDALFMAAHAINDRTHSSAILAISDEVTRKLVAAGKDLEELKEALK